ncbi:hypothetical protein EPJ79_06395 [Brachyspira aalborgi]|uniref:MmcQ/YjbR family DNA-binding protein n=1 Tax=Brachyspira aalborgi TaxID=29522 RepID=A0A5C8D5T2_9SPIR|nr:MmcQ/YjbR family DNA-binding protein [Brachyspira aalborgi]TXJ20764.1 hypothetical protein EPJ79_06395 [Brachyspira aalborgi]
MNKNFYIFKSKQSKQIIKYVKEKYNDELEFLWIKFPKYAIFRHKENKKWYALLVALEENKLGIVGDKIVDIIVLKNKRENIINLIDNEKYFAGYHMNKRNWFTIKLDDSITIKEIYNFIDESYNISNK